MRLESRILTVNVSLGNVLKALAGQLTINDNFKADVLTVSNTGTANVEMVLDHGLNKIPTAYFWNIDRAGTVYDSQRATWTATQLKLKCSVANAAITLVVF